MIVERLILTITFLFSSIVPRAWACTLVEGGVRKFELLCPTKKLESDCTCNIYGINVDVLSIGTGQSLIDVIAMIAIIGIAISSALYIKRKRIAKT